MSVVQCFQARWLKGDDQTLFGPQLWDQVDWTPPILDNPLSARGLQSCELARAPILNIKLWPGSRSGKSWGEHGAS
eukprot:2652758-Alexandrium_andersonii.AAC.1